MEGILRIMKILCDHHHSQLLSSLQLMGDRLGAAFSTMNGMGWFNEGYWKINNAEVTARQFLSSPQIGRGVTFEAAKDTSWDVVLCTHINQIPAMRKWVDRYCPKAKLVVQVGNEWLHEHENFHLVSNILNSTTSFFPSSFHQCHYHPEFPVNFSFKKVDELVSFTHLMEKDGIEFAGQLASGIKPVGIRLFGASCPDGPVNQAQVDSFIKTRLGLYLYKPNGDGYGFSGHMALANGMPVLTRRQDYHRNTLGRLLVEGVNFCDLDKGVDHVACFVKDWRDDRFNNIKRARGCWINHVDFNWEFDNVIKPFFEDLV